MIIPRKYKKRPVVIDAVQWDGTQQGASDICDALKVPKLEVWHDYLYIQTLEGKMRAEKGDYIIKGIAGEHYPCKPDIFEKTYEAL